MGSQPLLLRRLLLFKVRLLLQIAPVFVKERDISAVFFGICDSDRKIVRKLELGNRCNRKYSSAGTLQSLANAYRPGSNLAPRGY